VSKLAVEGPHGLPCFSRRFSGFSLRRVSRRSWATPGWVQLPPPTCWVRDPARSLRDPCGQLPGGSRSPDSHTFTCKGFRVFFGGVTNLVKADIYRENVQLVHSCLGVRHPCRILRLVIALPGAGPGLAFRARSLRRSSFRRRRSWRASSFRLACRFMPRSAPAFCPLQPTAGAPDVLGVAECGWLAVPKPIRTEGSEALAAPCLA
jgi:hypothetical protein